MVESLPDRAKDLRARILNGRRRSGRARAFQSYILNTATRHKLLVFAEKYRRIKRLESVDLVITDSPLINSAVYGGDQFGDIGPAFFEAIACRFDSVYFAVRRTAPYIAIGRMPDAEAAEEAGRGIIGHLDDMGAPWFWIDGNDEALGGVVEQVEVMAREREMRPLNEPQIRRDGQKTLRHAPGWDAPAAPARSA